MGTRCKKAPRSEVDASLRDLNIGSNKLPWTNIIFYGTSANGQRAVIIIGPGFVCLRVADGCFGRVVRKHVIATVHVKQRLGVGVGGGRARRIARAVMAKSSGVSNRSVIARGCVNEPPRQLTSSRRARASAQHRRAKIFRRGGANGRAATNISRTSMNNRASVFAAWRADWLCVACWIVKRVTACVGVVSAVSV